MPRFLGRNINNNNANFLDKEIAQQVSKSRDSDWYKSDWYSQTFQPDYNSNIYDLDAYTIKDSEGNKYGRLRCLDLTDSEMSNSPLTSWPDFVLPANVIPSVVTGRTRPLIESR